MFDPIFVWRTGSGETGAQSSEWGARAALYSSGARFRFAV